MEIATSFREFPASSFLFGQSLPSECLLLLIISSFHVCTWSRLERLILLQQSQIPEQQWRLDPKPQSISSGQCCTGKARRCSGIGLCRLRYCALVAPSSSLSSSSAASGIDALFAREHLLLLPACTSHWLELVEDSRSFRSSRVFAFSAAWEFVCFRSFL
jgi:hypothetical protein